MAGNAVIGALRVTLGLDSAQFTTGLASAQTKLGGFGKAAGVGLAAVAVAAAAAATALGVAVKRSIDTADAMAKMAQKSGVSVEALTRLGHAANLSGVSMEGLSTGLVRISKNMADIAAGAGAQAKTAFDALGISVTNADGTLKSSTVVLGEIADKFARMEDGSTKTALAVNILGRAGADLIPLLNGGSKALADMALEADRLGLTMSTKTAKAAEVFNDNLTRLGGMFQGTINQVMEGVIPALANVSSKFIESAMNSEILKKAAEGIVNTFKVVASAAILVVGAISSVTESINVLWMAINKRLAGEDVNAFLNTEFAKVGDTIKATIGLVESLWTEFDEGPTGEAITPFTANLVDVKAAADAAKESAKALKKELNDAKTAFEATRTPFEQMAIDIQKLDVLLANGKISWETYGRAVGQATASAAASTLGALANLSSGLSQAFEENKALSIATAVLKGAEAVASAFAAGNAAFGPIGGVAFAAVAAITAAANVAAVASTTQTSKSMSSPASASVPAAAAPEAAPLQTAVNVTLHGQSFGRDQIRELLESIADYSRDDSMIRVSAA